MLDISCEFLDTASTYTKYHEYHFLNHQIPLFHAPAVQIWSMQKNSTKRKKLTKYTKKSQKCPKFKQGVLNNVRRPHKKNGAKKTKKILPRVPSLALGKEALCRVPWQGTRGSQPLCRVPGCDTRQSNFFSFNDVGGLGHQVTFFFAECRSSPSVALGKRAFAECRSLPSASTWQSLSSPSAILPRVQHSGKIGFVKCPIFGTRGSLRHSGNFASPVVLPIN